MIAAPDEIGLMSISW